MAPLAQNEVRLPLHCTLSPFEVPTFKLLAVSVGRVEHFHTCSVLL